MRQVLLVTSVLGVAALALATGLTAHSRRTRMQRAEARTKKSLEQLDPARMDVGLDERVISLADRDGWDRPFRVAVPAIEHDVGRWRVWSVGADGIDEAGEGDDIARVLTQERLSVEVVPVNDFGRSRCFEVPPGQEGFCFWVSGKDDPAPTDVRAFVEALRLRAGGQRLWQTRGAALGLDLRPGRHKLLIRHWPRALHAFKEAFARMLEERKQ